MAAQFGPPKALRGLRLLEDIDDAKLANEPYPLGARRTGLTDAPLVEDVPIEAMIEREPVTVVCSQQGWIRAMKGHVAPDQELKYKDGDGERFRFHAETTDRLLAFASNGRFYTLGADRLPGGRGMGEPVRLMVDLPNEAQLVALFIHRPGERVLVASSAGDGFVVPEVDLIAQTRTGKQILNVRGDVTADHCVQVTGDHVAVVGKNRKLLIFPLGELPEMTRGKGVRLQTYRDKGVVLSDVKCLALEHGLSWKESGGRTRTETADSLRTDGYVHKRAGAGRMAPRGFPRDNKFT